MLTCIQSDAPSEAHVPCVCSCCDCMVVLCLTCHVEDLLHDGTMEQHKRVSSSSAADPPDPGFALDNFPTEVQYSSSVLRSSETTAKGRNQTYCLQISVRPYCIPQAASEPDHENCGKLCARRSQHLPCKTVPVLCMQASGVR